MAREKSFEERRREREQEEEDSNEVESLAARRRGNTNPNSEAKLLAGDGSVKKLLELFQRAEPLIEQLNSLYNQYFAGVERRPPLEVRKQLDQVMMTLQMMSKPTQAYQFRFNTLNASYNSHRDRWERLMKDLELGKIKIKK